MEFASKEQQWLFDETMKRLDASCEEASGMLVRSFRGREFHDLRGSCHYALGLLVRGQAGDRSRALKILRTVLDSQFKQDPSLAFYGGFPSDDRRPAPPADPYPGEHFDAVSRYYLEKWQEGIRGRFLRYLAADGFSRDEIRRIEALQRQAALETVPIVWGNWDANWREFVTTELAMILVWAEDQLPEELIRAIEEASSRAVTGSIRRYEDHTIPMNTNVELMHVFICGYFGERLGNAAFLDHAKKAAGEISQRYHETESFAEYNSTTYNSVDLVALSMWRQFLKTPELVKMGTELEEGLWRNICEMYHPGLNQISGPFARHYDDDMAIHSMIPAFLYIVFGEEKPRPVFNVETAGFLEIALNGTRMPYDVKEAMRSFTGPRRICHQFRELMERGLPGDDTSLCTVTATMEEEWMLGAMKGSRNTSGQLRSAAAYWRAPDGSVSSLELMRRVPGGAAGEHLWTVYFDGTVEDNHLDMTVRPEVDRDIELVFAIHGKDLAAGSILPDKWDLPGMRILVDTDAGQSEVRPTADGLEVVYLCPWTEERPAKTRHFHMIFQKSETSVRFGVFADLHYAAPGMQERGYSSRSLEDMKKGLERFRKAGVDFIVSLGDDLQPASDRAAEYDLMKDLLRLWKSMDRPVYSVFGNHEFQQLSYEDVQQLWKTDRLYQTFIVKGLMFLTLDTNVNPDGSHFSEDNFDWTQGILPQEQVLWLKEKLEKNMPTVILTHGNLYLPGHPEYCVLNHAEILEMISRSGCVKAVVQGHHHTFAYNEFEGIPFINIPSPEKSPAYSEMDFPIIEIDGDRILYNGTDPSQK